ncbi:hypothetical protein BDW74DRAFT_133763 [Aspergillus multicolor]|uniref:uncharacterized protein n=1 Tax=Aspergillus multicolor TaxID=41759 RepID=UPI003CCCF21D
MSRHAPPTAALGKGLSGTKATAPQDISGLFNTLQGHVDDIRGLIQCGICIRPLYEPFTLACGHTFCYGCLTSWFAEGKNNKTCPDCRAPVKSQPAPAYLVRAVVQLFTSRAELLDKGETTDQHIAHQTEEAERLEADKKNKDPKKGGIFRGIFNQTRHRPAQPIYDIDDGVVRCPHCAHELEDEDCLNCGYRHEDDSMSDTRSDSDENSEMTDDPYGEVDDDIEDGFGEAPGFDGTEWYDDEIIPAQYPGIQPFQSIFGFRPGYGPGGMGGMGGPDGLRRAFYEHYHGHSDFDSHDSTHGGDDEDEMDDDEDEDMDSFIDDGEQLGDYASDSDRETVVGGPEYGGTVLHTILDSSPASGYGINHTNSYEVPESDEDETSDEDDEDDTLNDEDGEGDDDDSDDDDDDDEEPIRPAVTGNRRIPTYSLLSSSSPLRANGATASNTGTRTQPPTVGSSATCYISSDDDSDEGPVGPSVRRARARPAAL